MFGVVLLPDEKGNQDGSNDDIKPDFERGGPVEYFPIVDDIDKHQESGGNDQHLAQMKFGERYGLQRAVVPETDNHYQDGGHEEQHHEVVHILPVVMVGQFGCEYHGYLSSGKYQRIKIRIKLASYVLGTENLGGPSDEPEHEETFQKTDEETADNDQVDVLRTGTYPTEKELQGQVGQQQELGGKGIEHFGNNRIGHSHSGRSGIIPHGDVFGVGTQCVGHFKHASGVGTVQHGDRQDDGEDAYHSEPVGNPLTYGDV